MRSWACIDELIRQRATLGAATGGLTSDTLRAIERAGCAIAFDRSRTTRVSFAVDRDVAAAQMNRTSAGCDATRQLRAAGSSLDVGLATVCASTVDGAGRSRVAVEY